MIEVVRMIDKDIPEVAELEKACFSMPWTERSLAESLIRPAYHMFAAKENDKVVGYIGTYMAADELNITNVAVDPARRREGIGALLIRTIVQMARAYHMSTIYLEVRESNQAAISLYQKYGFRRSGKRKNFYDNPKEDGLIMRLYLDDDYADIM